MSNGIVWREKKLIYFFIPKNGCTTLKQVFAKGQGMKGYSSPHSAPFHYIGPGRQVNFTDYTSFAVIRNPLDRLLSLYLDKIRPGYKGWGFHKGVESFVFGKYKGFDQDMSFEEFANACMGIQIQDANTHWTPQWRQIEKNGLYPDHLIRFERFSEDVPAFLAVHGINEEVLKMNPAWRKKDRDYKEYYTPELTKRAIEYYQKDVDLWYQELRTL